MKQDCFPPCILGLKKYNSCWMRMENAPICFSHKAFDPMHKLKKTTRIPIPQSISLFSISNGPHFTDYSDLNLSWILHILFNLLRDVKR